MKLLINSLNERITVRIKPKPMNLDNCGRHIPRDRGELRIVIL